MSAAPKIQKILAVKGMNDILPPASAHWEWLEEQVRAVMASFAYRNTRLPIVEPTPLFVRGIGEATDIVEKEMYSFEDKLNGDKLTLRPEGTAGVCRAAIEHNLLYEGGKRLYYAGPMFRHERPQRGRYRQFHQIGAEALGFGGAEVDAEIILLAHSLWQKIGLQGVQLQLNCLGQPEERRAHRAAPIGDGSTRTYSNHRGYRHPNANPRTPAGYHGGYCLLGAPRCGCIPGTNAARGVGRLCQRERV